MTRPYLILAVLLSAVPAWALPPHPILPARASETDRKTPQIPDSLPRLQIPAALRDSLANGMRLSLIEMHRLPLASVRLVFPFAGAASVDAGKEGLAGLAASMMAEGTRRLPDRTALAEALEETGGSIGVSVDADSLTVSVTTLKKNLDKALGLAADMLRTPSFSAPAAPPQAVESLARLKQEAFQGMKAEKGNPDSQAAKRLRARVFPAHPYGRGETEESIAAADIASLSSFHQKAVRPEGAVIAAAGDLDMAELKNLAEKHFGDWPGAPGEAPAEIPAPAPAVKDAGAVPGTVDWKIDLIDMPGSAQSTLRLGHAAIARNHPDYYAVQVMNRVLGGGGVGRLNDNLREKKSWTYHAQSGMTALRDGGFFSVETQVQNDKTAPAVLEVLSEIKRIQDEPVPEAELAAVKRFMTGSFLRANRTVQDVSGMLAGVEADGLPADTLGKWVENVGAVDPAAVQRAARAHLRYETIHIVLVGDAAEVYDALAGIAPVRVFDLDGNEKPAPAPADKNKS